MKEVFITETQYNILKNFIKENSKNIVPSVQDQVNKKVNTGIMDGVTCDMCEGAEPESNEYNIGMEGDSNLEYGHIYESNEELNYLNDYIKSILKYFELEGLKINPYPQISFDNSEQDGLFIKTGYYLPSDKKIVVYTYKRADKDILRSFCHELIHHMQNLEGKNMNFTNNDDVKDNEELERLEAEAYLKGNIYFRKWTEYERKKDNVLNEAIISKSQLAELTKELDEDERWTIYAPIVDESLEPNEVDLSSFNIKKNLNPKFWKNNKLDSRIRLKLLDIADDFIDFLNIKWVKHDDIIITGSLSNYNWSNKYSDIDLHILIDYSKVDKRTEFVSKYFTSLKKIWNEEHGDIKIFGFPVEVYVQDSKEKHISSGVYSLEKNEWLEEPERNKLAKQKVNKIYIKKKVSFYTKKIDEIEDLKNKTKNDTHNLEKIYEKAELLFDEIKNMRKNSLNDKNIEITENNIIFKCLRRLNYIDKLSNIIKKLYNNINSLS